MQITNNAKAFLGAGLLVTAFSIALALSGVIGGDDEGPGVIVAGDTFTPVIDPTPSPSGDVRAAPDVLTLPPPDNAPAVLLLPAAAATIAPAGPPITTLIDVPVLMYHRVLPELPEDEFDARLTVRTADLEAQVAYLVCSGFTPITVHQLFEGFAGSATLPEHPVILTFDDGWEDHYSNAFPVLQSFGVPGSFAIVTGFVDSDGPYVTWGQVEEMAAAGMEVLSHSVSHTDLGDADDAVVLDEIGVSKADLEAHTGGTVEFFVYPSGEPFRSYEEDRQAEVVQMLRDAGYRGALLATNSVTLDPTTPFALNRVRVSGGEDIQTFAASIYGPTPTDSGCP